MAELLQVIPESLYQLLKEIEAADPEAFPPTRKALPSERVIGVPTGYAKKVWSLLNFYTRERERLVLEVKYADESESGRLRERLEKTDSREDMLKELFWFLCRALPETHGTKSLGLRKDWKIVQTSGPADFLRGLLEEL